MRVLPGGNHSPAAVSPALVPHPLLSSPQVVDECASCDGNGDVDFSIAALKAITGYSWDRKRIEWEWTSCDGGRKLLSDDGSSETYTGTAGLLEE